MNTAALGEAPAQGFRDPVLDAQSAFRTALDAMSWPGRIVPFTVALDPPPPLFLGTMALLLALADRDTPVWLDRAARGAAVLRTLRFHCGCRMVEDPGAARFAVIAAPGDAPPLARFDHGTDERPELSATVIVQVDSLSDGAGVRMTGPGNATAVRLAVSGLDGGFWRQRKEMEALFPRGIDFLFVHRDRVVALPRSTRIEV